MNDAQNHAQAYARYLELRYKESYDDAKTLRKFGSCIKYVGIAIAAIVGLAIPVYYSMMNMSEALWLNRVGMAICILIVFYIVSTAICGMSDILKVTTDTAINSSPMLSNEQKAEIILHKVMTHESMHHKIDREINA